MYIDFRETGRGERERETSIWERNINQLPPIHSDQEPTHNPAMCPDQGSISLQPFGTWNNAPTNWATGPGQTVLLDPQLHRGTTVPLDAFSLAPLSSSVSSTSLPFAGTWYLSVSPSPNSAQDTRGEPPKTNIYKNMCIYSYMFKLQLPSKNSPLDAVHLLRLFSPAQNSSWTCQFWCLLVLLPFSVSSLSHQQNVSLWGLFFIRGNKRKSQLGLKIRWIGWVGHRGPWYFGSKTTAHSDWCGQVSWLITRHEIGKSIERVKKKNSLKLNAASHNNAN